MTKPLLALSEQSKTKPAFLCMLGNSASVQFCTACAPIRYSRRFLRRSVSNRERSSRLESTTLLGSRNAYSRSHDAVIRIYGAAGNVIETHEDVGDFVEP